jgi:hypothetical protein
MATHIQRRDFVTFFDAVTTSAHAQQLAMPSSFLYSLAVGSSITAFVGSSAILPNRSGVRFLKTTGEHAHVYDVESSRQTSGLAKAIAV